MSEALFLTAAGRVSVALAGGLGLVVIAERRHLRELTGRTLFRRWRTWAVTAPIFGAAVLGPLPLAVVFVAVVSAQALREYSALVRLTRGDRVSLHVLSLSSSLLAAYLPGWWASLAPAALFPIILSPLFGQDSERGAERASYALFGFFYIPVLLAFLILVRTLIEGGSYLLLAVGMAVATSDVVAFTTGKLLGRIPLSPRLSPAKTVEGALGNVAGAYLGFGLMHPVLPNGLGTAVLWTLPLAIGLACIAGDLLESLLKRQCGVKDAGSWLPGFGGMLDRIDSLLFALPAAYALVAVLS